LSRIVVVEFTEALNHPQLEIIPERHGAVWRVLNKTSQAWPAVRIGDYLDVIDLNDVKVIPRTVFDSNYEFTEDDEPTEAPPERQPEPEPAIPQH